MFTKLSNELPQNEVGGNKVDSVEGNDNNKNVNATDCEIESSEP